MKYVNKHVLAKLYILGILIKVIAKFRTKLGIRKLSWLVKLLNKRKEIIIFDHIKCYTAIKNYRDNKIIGTKNENKIWVLWMQGESSAPLVVKRCIESIRENSGDFELIVLDKNNITDYIKLPDFIWSKYQSGKITNTHLSDIIRSYLLSKYGGYWIDSTVFVIKPLFKPDIDFLTLRDLTNTSNSISEGQWTGYFIYSLPGDKLMTQLLDVFINYWENENVLLDYFLIDYVIKFFVLNDFSIKKSIARVPNNGSKRFLLHNLMNCCETFDRNNSLKDSYGVFKLSYKADYLDKIEGNPTYFSLILEDKLLSSLRM